MNKLDLLDCMFVLAANNSLYWLVNIWALPPSCPVNIYSANNSMGSSANTAATFATYPTDCIG